MITFACEKCGQVLCVDDFKAGLTEVCSQCGNYLVVPKKTSADQTVPPTEQAASSSTQPLPQKSSQEQAPSYTPPPSQQPPPQPHTASFGGNPPVGNTKTWSLLCHLGGLAVFIGVPFGNIIVPLVIWCIKRDEMPLVDQEGKKALNFQISVTIYLIASVLLMFIFIGFFLAIAVMVFNVICIIQAAVKTSNGESYDYPLSLKLIK